MPEEFSLDQIKLATQNKDVDGVDLSGPTPTKSERDIAFRRAIMAEQFDFAILGSTFYGRDKSPHSSYLPLGEAGFKRLATSLMPLITDRDATQLYKTTLMSTPFLEEEHLFHIRFGDMLWDMTTASLVEFDLTPDSTSPRAPKNVFWHCDIAPGVEGRAEAADYFRSLASGNPKLAEDIIASIAVTFLKDKPRGAYWWMGDGMNGKGTLLRLLHSLFPGQICDVDTLKMQDQRELAPIASSLGNFVLDASEARVDRTDVYKRIADHEPFTYRPLYSNDTITVTRSVNSIFAVNNIPVFEDKTRAIASRNKIIPFRANFTGMTPPEFTLQFKAGLLSLILEKARKIYLDGNVISWSEETQMEMREYEDEMNNVMVFLEEERANSMIGVKNVGILYDKYVSWCNVRKGQVALGKHKFSRSMNSIGLRLANNIRRFPDITDTDIKAAVDVNGVYYRTLPPVTPLPTITQASMLTEGDKYDSATEW